MSSVIRKYAALCIVCLCSSLFFLGLYHFDNKYSQNTIQAANGILALSENDLKKSPVRFLVSGWEFYPDALLTPEEIQDSDHYMRYLSIGEMSNFSSPAAPSPYGCGTYRMTFFLPERKEAYAIELPEVFSSYTLISTMTGSCSLEIRSKGSLWFKTEWSLFMEESRSHSP